MNDEEAIAGVRAGICMMPLPTLILLVWARIQVAYLNGPYEDGLDDRGAVMALWFAVEMARLEAGV